MSIRARTPILGKNLRQCGMLGGPARRRMREMANTKRWESKELGVVIEVDYDKCSGIGQCVAVCPSGVYELVQGKTTAPNIDGCIQCCACQEACPVVAIKHSSCQ